MTIIQPKLKHLKDTRTHVVGELYDTERSYVESLQILIEVSVKDLLWACDGFGAPIALAECNQCNRERAFKFAVNTQDSPNALAHDFCANRLVVLSRDAEPLSGRIIAL